MTNYMSMGGTAFFVSLLSLNCMIYHETSNFWSGEAVQQRGSSNKGRSNEEKNEKQTYDIWKLTQCVETRPWL